MVGRQGIVLVKCWAAPCGACRVLTPIFLKVAAKHPEHTFAALDTLTEEALSASLEIVHVPTLLLYRDGILLFHQAGNFSESRIDDIIAQAEALDMDVVRAEIDGNCGEEEPAHHAGM
jgi:thioredoxin 1